MRKFASLAALAVSFASLTALADDSEWYAGSPSPAVRALGTPREKASAYLTEHRAALRLEGVTLVPTRLLANAGQAEVVRYEQRVAGLRVLGKGAAVRIDGDGEVVRVVLGVARGLSPATTPSLSVGQAEDAASSALGRALPPAERSELVVSPLAGGTLVWQLDVRDSPGGTRYFVDAVQGTLVGVRPLAVEALGRVYEKNAVESPVPVDVTLNDLDVATPQYLNGWNGLLAVTNWVSGGSQNGFTVEQTLQPSAGADFLYDPPAQADDPTDGFAQVNLYHHLTSMRAFATTLGVAIDTPSWKVTAVANAEESGQPLDNAFFSEMGQTGAFAAPNLIAIGQGTLIDFAYDSDVFKHEFGHYLTHNTVGYNLGQLHLDSYGISPFSGSIDEGIADYLACSEADDAELGEASLGPLGSERILTDTSKACPADVWGEVHADGEIIGSISWSIRTALGQAVGDQLVWGAVTTLLPGASFGDFGRGLIASAQALEAAAVIQPADVATVEALVAARGLDECDQVLPIDAGETKHITVVGLETLGQAFGGSCGSLVAAGIEMPGLFHFSYQPAAGDEAVRFTIAAEPAQGPGDLDFTIYVRRDQHVSFKPGLGGLLPVVDAFDSKVDFTGTSAEIVIDASSVQPFDPSAQYFFAVVNRGCPTLALAATANAYVDPGAGGSGGAGGAGGTGGGGLPADSITDDSGCGCRVVGGDTSGGGGLSLLGLALGAVGAWRRRRGRSA